MKAYLIVMISLLFSLNGYANVAKITALQGSATIERQTQSLKGTLGADLLSHDIIKTDLNSKAQITFKDNTIITVGKQSRFSIDEYLFNASDAPSAKFNVINGTVRAMSGKIGKIAPEKFTVKTKTATIGIRGTDFIVSSDNDNFMYVYCIQGSIVVWNNNIQAGIIEAGSYIKISLLDNQINIQPFNKEDMDTLLKKGFAIQRSINDKNKLTEEIAISEKVDKKLLHSDESLEKENLVDTDELLSETGIQIITDTIPSTPSQTQTYTGLMTSYFKYNWGNHLKEGTLTLTSDPSTQTVTGDIQVPAIYSTIHLGSTNTYTDVNSFNIQLASIEDSSNPSTITPFPSGSNLKTCACATEDYFAWGEWEKVQDPTDNSDYKAHGYWIAGVETPASVLDDYRNNSQSFLYAGNTIAEVNTLNSDGTLMGIGSFSGSSEIEVDFETDTFEAAFEFSNISDEYTLKFSGSGIETNGNKLETTTIDALQSDNHGDFMGQTPGGHLKGAFYGDQGKTVGGIYNVTTNVPSSGDSLVIQGAFQATAP